MGYWRNAIPITPRNFKCGYCGFNVASNQGYIHDNSNFIICICPNCDNPTYFQANRLIPASLMGNDVTNTPPDINSLYIEARACTGVNAYTAAVLVCRKLLMHIAVEQGAEEGKNFMEYVEYLSDKNYVPPHGKIWVDHIRQKGNEANHEIVLMKKEDAEDLITFIEMLLKFIYEFPSKIKK